MQEAYFENIRSKIILLLRNASHEVSIAMAWFTSAELFSELIKCLNRGVKVSLVLFDSPINFMEYAPDFNEFIKVGGELYIASSDIGLMHHKFCIIDDEIVITGSYNWTYYAENRNVENIVVTNNPNVVGKFKREAERLINLIGSKSPVAPRYSMSDIEAFNDIDFKELNEEIENICHVQNRQVKNVFETHTEVVISETRLTPVASNTIGIMAINENDQEELDAFIETGEKLPTERSRSLFLDSKKATECPCKIGRANKKEGNDKHLIKEEDILKVAEGTSEENLKISFSMRLEDNGSLRVDVYCEKTGRRMTISALDKSLVKYE